MSQPAAGRRRTAATRGLHPLLVIAVLVPILTVLVAQGLRQPQTVAETGAPQDAPLTRADRGCPAAPAKGGILVANARPEATGEIELRRLDQEDVEPESVPLSSGATADLAESGPVLVTGHDDLAPGLLATRVAAGRLAGVVCPAPAPDAWFTGLGARAEHASVLELQNPDVGAAVVDVSFFTRQGAVDVPELLGVRVPGRSTYVVDLAQQVPRRGDVAVHLAVTRGRLSATVRDRFERIGSDTRSVDWLAPQAGPATETLLLGLPAGRGYRTLTLANPGEDQARVDLKLVTEDSTFAPADLKQVQVRPGSLVNVHLDKILAREVRKGALGVQVTATRPVTSTFTSLVHDDLTVAQAPPAVDDTASVLLPPGDRTMLVAGATTTGLVTVTFRDADGGELPEQKVEVTPGRAFTVPVPAKATLATMTVARTSVSAAVLVEGDGALVLPFGSPAEVGLVPSVRPADR
ncbi:DUF5719 family protein [Nocardioides sp.]|uniref:DUF5719 family protein n=1 Tax=Nocardioides sp. TaxID=35761 RepID=UPI003526D5DA